MRAPTSHSTSHVPVEMAMAVQRRRTAAWCWILRMSWNSWPRRSYSVRPPPPPCDPAPPPLLDHAHVQPPLPALQGQAANGPEDQTQTKNAHERVRDQESAPHGAH